MPSHIGRMPVRLLVDVRDAGDQHEREQDDGGGESPSAVGFGRNVAVDVVSHGGNIDDSRREGVDLLVNGHVGEDTSSRTRSHSVRKRENQEPFAHERVSQV